MSRVILVFFLLQFSAFLCAQGASAALPNSSAAPNTLPVLPNKPAEIFAAAVPLYDFTSPTLKPWHMKVSYQLYDEKGASASKGSYEYWWISPERYRKTWQRQGLDYSYWLTGAEEFGLQKGERPAIFEQELPELLLNAVPTSELLAKSELFNQTLSNRGAVLPCVQVMPKKALSRYDQAPLLGMFPTYCFDPMQTVLRAAIPFVVTQVNNNSIFAWQGR